MKPTQNMTDRAVIDVAAVKNRMISVRGETVLLDRDVAALYGVQTKEVNQAARNNPDKFPDGFLFQLDAEEFAVWKSKFLTSKLTDEERPVTSWRRSSATTSPLNRQRRQLN